MVPQVAPADRIAVTDLGGGFFTVLAHFGFMETADVPKVLEALASHGLSIEIRNTSFYLGRETLIPIKRKGEDFGEKLIRRMPMWRKRLFVLMANNARPATAFFNLPPNRVVEMGAQIQI